MGGGGVRPIAASAASLLQIMCVCVRFCAAPVDTRDLGLRWGGWGHAVAVVGALMLHPSLLATTATALPWNVRLCLCMRGVVCALHPPLLMAPPSSLPAGSIVMSTGSSPAYVNSMYCSWYLQAPAGYQYTLSLINFRTELSWGG